MKISFTNFRKKYGPWWGRFSSAVVATICGISLTFGLTYWKTLNDKKKLMHTSEVWAMANILETIEDLDEDINNLNQQLKTINTVKELYDKDSLKNCPDSIVNEFLVTFLNIHIAEDNDNLEQMPFDNLKLTSEADDIREISEIHDLWQLVNLTKKTYNAILAEFNDIGRKHLPYTINKKAIEAVNSVISNKEVYFYFNANLPLKIHMSNEVLKISKEKYKKELKSLNITEEELKEFKSSLFEKKRINIAVEK